MKERGTTRVVGLAGVGLAVALLAAACGSDEREDDVIAAGDAPEEVKEDGSIDAGDVTASEVEGANDTPLGRAGTETDRLARLQADAIVRLVTVDHGFGTGIPPFDLVQVASVIGGDTTRPVDPLALELTADELSDRFPVEFVSDADTIIADHFDEQTIGVAVASIDDMRFDGERAEVEMALWCGSLCGVFLTYEAVLGSTGWEIVGTTGPIAMS